MCRLQPLVARWLMARHQQAEQALEEFVSIVGEDIRKKVGCSMEGRRTLSEDQLGSESACLDSPASQT